MLVRVTLLPVLWRAMCAQFLRQEFFRRILLFRQVPGDIRTGQERLGHTDVFTMVIYTHVLNIGGHRVVSPLDAR